MKYEQQKQSLIKAVYAISVIALVIFIFRYAIFWLMPFVFAFGVAFVTKPLTNMITQGLKCNQKPVAALVCFLFYGTIGVLVTVIAVNLVVAVREWAIDIPQLYEERFLPDMAETYQDIVTLAGRISPELALEVEAIAANTANELHGLVSNISGTLLSKISSLALAIPSMFISVIFAVIGSLFISMDYYRITNFLVGQFNEKNQEIIRSSVAGTPRVQIVVGDGLSSAAITANAMDCLHAIRDGLKARGIETGKSIFVRYCRVGAGDAVGDVTGCELVCVLVGERPGLVTDKSMSAYITYQPRIGVSESSRTVVSNIHAQGTPPVEAGAHVAELIDTILKKKVSGVGLHLEAGA